MSTEVTKKFADILGQLVSETGKSLKELAKEIGVSYGSISKYQNDNAAANIDALCKFADYFNVSTDYLLGRTEEPTPIMDERAASEYTGLSAKAIQILHEGENDFGRRFYRRFFDSIIENDCEIIDDVLHHLSKAAEATIALVLHYTKLKEADKTREEAQEAATQPFEFNDRGEYVMTPHSVSGYWIGRAADLLTRAERIVLEMLVLDMAGADVSAETISLHYGAEVYESFATVLDALEDHTEGKN